MEKIIEQIKNLTEKEKLRLLSNVVYSLDECYTVNTKIVTAEYMKKEIYSVNFTIHK